MLSFKIARDEKNDREVIEIWDEDVFVASIYMHDENINIVSKYLSNVFINKSFPKVVSLMFNHKEDLRIGG